MQVVLDRVRDRDLGFGRCFRLDFGFLPVQLLRDLLHSLLQAPGTKRFAVEFAVNATVRPQGALAFFQFASQVRFFPIGAIGSMTTIGR